MDNYPMMSASELRRAPFNQTEPPDKEFELTCSQSLSKSFKVTTNMYNPVIEDEPHNRIYEEYSDTSDTNWADVFHSNGHFTPIQLIKMLKGYITRDLTYGDSRYSEDFLNNLLEECDKWTIDEEEFIEE